MIIPLMTSVLLMINKIILVLSSEFVVDRFQNHAAENIVIRSQCFQKMLG